MYGRAGDRRHQKRHRTWISVASAGDLVFVERTAFIKCSPIDTRKDSIFADLKVGKLGIREWAGGLEEIVARGDLAH